MKTKPIKESAVLKSIIAELVKLKVNGHRVWWVKLHGGPMQTAGLPDLHVLVNGMPFYLEVKRPGGKATTLQEATMEKIATAGGATRVVSSAVEALEFLVTMLGAR